VAADNVAASIAGLPTRDYRHRDLGMVVDLGGHDAVAKPLGVDLSGVAGAAVTRAYHLWALKAPSSMTRVATNWALGALHGASAVRLGFLHGTSGRLAEFEHTDDYLDPAQVRDEIARTSAAG
jgi:NADH dehydrogenase